MKMSFPGIAHTASAIGNPPPRPAFGGPNHATGTAHGAPDVTSSMSGAARQLGRLARLQEDDPAAFQAAAAEIADTLRGRADEVGDGASEALNDLALRFQSLSADTSLGDLFIQRPDPRPFHDTDGFPEEVVFAEVASAVRSALP